MLHTLSDVFGFLHLMQKGRLNSEKPTKKVAGAIWLAEAKVHSEENLKPRRLDLELERNGEKRKYQV